MKRPGSVVRSAVPASLVLSLALGITVLGQSGCGSYPPEPTPEEIKTSRINKVLNAPLQKAIDAAEKKKARGRGKR
jgi:hypothetical protein